MNTLEPERRAAARWGRGAGRAGVALVAALALTFGTGALAASATTPDETSEVPVVDTNESMEQAESAPMSEQPSAAPPVDTSTAEPPATIDETPPPAEPSADDPSDAAKSAPLAAQDRGGDRGERDGTDRDGKDRDGKDRDGQNDKDGDGKDRDGKDRDGKDRDGKDRDGKDKDHDGKDRDGKDKDKDKDKDRPKGHQKVCHPRGHDGEWEPQTPSVSDIVGWGSESRGVSGAAIIPPFTYTEGDRTHRYPGQNWDHKGESMWKHHCKHEPPTVSLDPPQCTTPGGEPAATVPVTIGNLKKWQKVTVTITLDGVEVSSQHFTAEGSTAMLDMPVAGVGTYVATVHTKGAKHGASTEFSVDACPPVPVPDPTPEPVTPAMIKTVVTPPAVLATTGDDAPVGSGLAAVWAGMGLVLVGGGLAAAQAVRRVRTRG